MINFIFYFELLNSKSSKPAGYSLIWTDAGSGAHDNVKIYELTPHPGYKCLGHVAVRSGTPDLSNYRCVRNDYTADVSLNIYPTWEDRGSGAYGNFAAYDIQASSSVINMGVFWSEAGYYWPKDWKKVPSLKVQASVQCFNNC